MTPLDGFLMVAGFVLGCLPVVESWLVQRGGHFTRGPRKFASSPWI